MFLFSGPFKESLNIPFDISALFLAFILIAVCWDIIKKPVLKKPLINPIILFFSLLSIILLSILINGGTDSSIQKIIKFVTLTMPTFLLPLLFIKSKESIKKILLSISILAVVLSLFSLSMILNNTGLFVGFNNGNYQGLARTTGIGFITLSYFFLSAKKKQRIIILPFLLLVSFTLLSAGSRMPLLAIVIIAFFAIGSSFVFKRDDILIKKKSLTGISLGLLLSLFLPYLYAKGYFTTIIYRFQVLFEGDGGASAEGRTNRIEAALEMFKDNIIIGGGIGNFGNYYIFTEGVYAHNIFLEFLSELGLIGLFWFILFLILVLYRSVYIYNKENQFLDGIQITLLSCFLFFMLNAMVSGDINANRAVFAFGSMLIISPYILNKNHFVNSTKLTA